MDNDIEVALILVGVSLALVALMAIFDQVAAWLNGPDDKTR